MTIEAPPIWLQGGTYPARLDRFLIAQEWDEGVLSPTACKVTQRGAGANFSVDIAVGEFVIQGDDQALQGNYMARVTATENVAIGAAPGSNSRYDLVTLRVNDPNAGGSAGNTVTAVVVAGTPAASPTVPALPASSIAIAIVGPIATATASITNSLIHDAHTGTGPTGVSTVRLLAGKKLAAGTLLDFMGASDWVPNGWIVAFGQAISRTTFAGLFAMLGTVYGVGDGSTTFNVPDLRGRVPVALDNMGGSDAGRLAAANTLGGNGGEELHTLTQAELPNATISIDPPSTSVAVDVPSFNLASYRAGPTVTVGASSYNGMSDIGANGGAPNVAVDPPSFNINVDIAAFNSGALGSGNSHNNMQPYILVNKIIRT